MILRDSLDQNSALLDMPCYPLPVGHIFTLVPSVRLEAKRLKRYTGNRHGQVAVIFEFELDISIELCS